MRIKSDRESNRWKEHKRSDRIGWKIQDWGTSGLLCNKCFQLEMVAMVTGIGHTVGHGSKILSLGGGGGGLMRYFMRNTK